MDVVRYLEKKLKGGVTLASVGDSFALEYKKYDSDTGAEIAPEVIAIDRNELLAEKTRLQAQIADIDAVISDMDALLV